MDDPLPLLDRMLAEPRHLLVLREEVTVAQVETLAAAHFDDAGRTGPDTLRLTGSARLTGPWLLDEPLRRHLDLPRWAQRAMLLRCPVERSAPVPRELLGHGGLRDAFPDGEPIGIEGTALRHLLAQARRLAGALRLAGLGTVLVPDPTTATDLTVHAPVWLDPDTCRHLLAATLPGIRLLHEDVPTEAPRPRPPTELPDSVPPLAEAERARLHAEADALDQAVLSQPQVLEGYGLMAPVEPGPRGATSAPGSVPAGDLLEVGVAGDVPPPPVLRAEQWARAGVVSYEVRWRPADPQSGFAHRPPLAARRRRDSARLLVEQITATLHDAVGGQILDDDGFVVTAESLRRGSPD